jgi:hypothetical protein
MAQPISRGLNSAEARIQSQAISCEIYDRRSGIGTEFLLGTPGFSFQYHSTNVTFIILSPTVRNFKICYGLPKTRLKGTGDSYPRNTELIQTAGYEPHTCHSRLQQAGYKQQPILCLASIGRLHEL